MYFNVFFLGLGGEVKSSRAYLFTHEVTKEDVTVFGPTLRSIDCLLWRDYFSTIGFKKNIQWSNHVLIRHEESFSSTKFY